MPTIKQYDIGALISVINAQMMIDTPSSLSPSDHLKLSMNDISTPTDGLVLPGQSHVEQMIKFVQNWDQQKPLLIHCWAGISRSTAGVLIALCALNPDVAAANIAKTIRDASSTATPNIRLVSLADDILNRGGAMVEAVEQIGRGEMAYEGDVFCLPAMMT